MGKHTGLFGASKVASKWRELFESVKEGDDFNEIKNKIGEPDQFLNLGDVTVYSYVSEEWKGFLRGGSVVRKMDFSVKNGKVISKSGQNLDRIAW